jgi:hypothetical protein
VTNLTRPVHRLTRKLDRNKPIIVTLAPCGSQDEALIGLRRKGERTQYVVTVSDVYRWAALTHGNKERIAKAKARKEGTPWKRAKKQFNKANSIPA